MRRAVSSCTCRTHIRHFLAPSQTRALSLGGLFGGAKPQQAAGDQMASRSVNAEVASFAEESTQTTIAQQMAHSVDSPGSKTLIQRMDDSWASAFESFGFPHFGFIDGGCAWLQVIDATLGIGWPVTLLGFGFAVRMITLWLSLYGERATLRMVLATKDTKKEHEEFDLVYRTGSATSLEIREAGERMKAARAAACKKHNTSMLAMMAPFAGAPIFGGGFAVVLRALEIAPRALVQSNMHVPEPTGLLAVGAVCATLMNFELTLARKRAGAVGPSAIDFAPWVARSVAIGAISVAMHLQAGLLVYWLGMSLAGLLQPALMAMPAFRKWYGVPDISTQPSTTDVRGTGVFAGAFPTMAKLLRPGGPAELLNDWEASRDSRSKPTAPRATSWRNQNEK